ncbi:ribosome maturation factor RimM [Paucibacter sp. JuS9]|uniref:ribosome maturation factor RimM n=1 Tax=Paucibacter sp. JuS9 TaxID=3228748 RepID=UPI0037570F34
MTASSDLQTSVTEPAWPDDAIEVGRLLDAWGVKGWIKVQAYSPDAQALFSSRRWFLKPADDNKPAVAGKAKALPTLLKILAVRDHGDGIVANIEGVTDRSGAEALGGARIFLSRSSFPKPETDEYYWVDLIGLAVVNRQGEELGTVAGLMDTGPHSVLRITPPGLQAPVKPDQERLIPFVAAFIDDVDLAERRISVDWGLDY